MQRIYEAVCIIKPEVGDETVKGIVEKVRDVLEKGKGTLDDVEKWGRRRLAYPIQKKNEGYYILLNFSAPPDTAKELDRVLKLNEDVMRHQIIRLHRKEQQRSSSRDEKTREDER